MKVKRKTLSIPVLKWPLIFFLCGVLLFSAVMSAAAAIHPQSVDEGRAIFDLKCKACHTIGGGDLVGPDLAGVTERRDLAWLERFISEPNVVLAEGDPIAAELLAKYNNVSMPNLALTADQVAAVLAFLESGETLQIGDTTLPTGSSQSGQDLFLGRKALQNGSTPCIGCHTVGSVGTFGGGSLGPDLTQVYTRFGEAGLGSSLQNIAFPTMLNVYAEKPLTDQEVADLVAFFEDANAQQAGTAQKTTGIFWLIGGAGALAVFGIMAFFWPRQRESLSDRLRKSA